MCSEVETLMFTIYVALFDGYTPVTLYEFARLREVGGVDRHN
jgi:hypothetical protein